MEGEQPIPQVIAPVVETGHELTQPVIDMAAKTAHIEEQQRQQEERLLREIGGVEERMRTASGESLAALESRLSGLETRLSEMATATARPVEEIATMPAEMVDATIEASPSPPEKEKHGRRARKKKRRANA